ncbi:MAG TPA: DUF1616 domain-containing protein [Chloroflexota bacterium]|nr:DUF1616 domain-containing protein [Chloroflexota bacterium]
MTAKVTNRLIMILVTAVLMLLTLLDWELGAVRVLFAVALVAILPGYALTTAIFVKYPLGFAEKLAFSCGLSLGLAAIGGLLLHFTPWGLQPASWVMYLGSITIIANVLALGRMQQTAQVDLSVIQVPLRLHQLLLMLLAGGVLMGAYLTARAGAENRPAPPFTQLWLLWADEAETQLQVGIQNQETAVRQYRLELSNRQGQMQEWPVITLAAGETWQTDFASPPIIGETDFIKATLYRLDAPQEIYRQVYLRRVVR